MMQDLAFAIPGVDEAMSFAEIMKYAPFSNDVAFLLRRSWTDMSNLWSFR
jgi:hypothetical protein